MKSEGEFKCNESIQQRKNCKMVFVVSSIFQFQGYFPINSIFQVTSIFTLNVTRISMYLNVNIHKPCVHGRREGISQMSISLHKPYLVKWSTKGRECQKCIQSESAGNLNCARVYYLQIVYSDEMIQNMQNISFIPKIDGNFTQKMHHVV